MFLDIFCKCERAVLKVRFLNPMAYSSCTRFSYTIPLTYYSYCKISSMKSEAISL